MIEYLRLERWRAYDHLELNLEPGTTFVVARNGIGKTSLIEAARFATTGLISKDHAAHHIRAGASDAEVEVRLRLFNGSLLTIVRRLAIEARKPVIHTRADVDGQALENGPDELLEQAWRAPLGFVATTAFVQDSLHRGGPDGVRKQLARAFGVEALQGSLAELAAAVSEITRRVTTTDKELRDDAADHQAAADLVRALEAEVEARVAVEDEAAALLAGAESAAERSSRAEEAARRHAEWQRRHAELVQRVETVLGERIVAGSLEAFIRQFEAQAQARLDEVRGNRAALQAQLDSIRAAGAELSEGPVCPVCRQPLDDTTRSAALEAHGADIDRLDAQLAELMEEDLAQAVDTARGLSDAYLRLGPEPPSAQAPTEAIDVDRRRGNWQAAVKATAAARSDLSRAVSELARIAEQAERVDEVKGMYRELALIEVGHAALERTIQRVLTERVEPLVAAIRRRWKHLFPDRPDIQLDVDGQFHRSIAGFELPFDAFSTGERAAAQLLLRLVLVDAATCVGACWVDEPLEHLDPTSRRLVGGLLAQATAETPDTARLRLRQLLVTTYEEPLARRLEAAIPGTHLCYIAARPIE